MNVYEYEGKTYPEYLKHGNAKQYIEPIARQFCRGPGLDIGPGQWPLSGAIPHDIEEGGAYQLPDRKFLYIFSSHCLEHLDEPYRALQVWRDHLMEGGQLFLYLPHPDMAYWRPGHCEKHKHIWHPKEIVGWLESLKFKHIFYSERDLNWSFAVTGVYLG